jgi:hypothetical protein
MLKKISCFAGSLADRFQGNNEPTPEELELAGDRVSPENISFSVRTGSRLDVGSWFRKVRVLACVLPGELFLVAPGICPYIDRIPFSELQESLYNHVTGEVVLAPWEGPRIRKLRMSPLDGSKVLEYIQGLKN